MAKAKYIVILGPDGSGKTTVADELFAMIGAARPARRKNFSFGIVPSLSTVIGRKNHSPTPVAQPNSGMVNPLKSSHAAVLAFWYGLDHLMGHFLLRHTWSGEVVIFARSYHDFLYQRAYLNLPNAIPKFFIFIGPKPDIIVTPIRPHEEVHAQKPELTAEEIKDQYFRISESLNHIKFFYEIDASSGAVSVAKNIIQKLKL